ncbi:hypothetical protein QR680_004110 [Steinernema hermaphroditum]|uniref:Uncharacterized protein n=1 Tax=Steinernema hermaphroditum TaxID=289476 RepID=A0AA39HPW6_9BILA|nr:hypothetical protein QR680_004110 [Steinernema hermaphroditum]
MRMERLELSCCSEKLEITTIIKICSLIHILFVYVVLALVFFGKLPNDLQAAFLIYAGLQSTLSVFLMVAVLRKIGFFLSIYLNFLIVFQIYAFVCLFFSITNQWNIRYFIQNYHWFDGNEQLEDQDMKGHVIQGMYSLLLLCYIVFTFFAMGALQECRRHFRKCHHEEQLYVGKNELFV